MRFYICRNYYTLSPQMYQKTQNSSTEIVLLENSSKLLEIQIKDLLEDRLTNEALSQINVLRLKIYNNGVKIQNIKAGLPQNGIIEGYDGYTILGSGPSSTNSEE